MTVLEARYELGHRIGGGGMAEVVEAYDRKLDRRVAVKLLRFGAGDPRAHERFVHEAQAAARFTHPNVVRVYDVGEAGGQPYLVMELIEGRTLREVLDERGKLPVEQVLAVGDSLLAALAAAHAHGLVHRDVKPANVLIGRDGRVKLADFGIAKAVQGATASLTATGQIIGTPAYLSPEQVDGKESTPRTDLYALGVVIYEMLAGEPPFHADQPFAVALAHRDDPVPPLEAHRPEVSPALAAVVVRALEKDPARRFESAGEMRRALESARNGSSGVAPDATIATAAPGSTRTLPMAPPAPDPSSSGTTRSRPTRKRSLAPPVALFLVAAIVGLAAGLVAFSGSDPSQRGAIVDTSTPTFGGSVRPFLTTTSLPTTLDGLIAMLAGNPGLAGERHDDLLDKLFDLQEDPDKGKDAEKLVSEIEKWVAEGEFDPNIGALATQILTSTFGGSFEPESGGDTGD